MRMIFAFVGLAFLAKVSGICEDDSVPLEAGRFPSEWNVGNIPHLFYNSMHMRGVMKTRDLKIKGLDTVTTSLIFCPVNMTIYGNLKARRIEFVGNYANNMDFINHGLEVTGHGNGLVHMTLNNVHVRNIRAKLRYSRAAKKLQIDDDMQYEAFEEMDFQNLTGFDFYDNGKIESGKEEFMRVENSNNSPSFVEFFKYIVNFKAKRGILLNAAKQVFAGAF